MTIALYIVAALIMAVGSLYFCLASSGSQRLETDAIPGTQTIGS